MGPRQSRQAQFVKMVSKVTTKIMGYMSTEAAGAATNRAEINIAGNVRGLNITQTARVNLTVLASGDTNASLRAEVANDIVAELKREDTDFPQIGSAMSEQDMDMIVRNIVDTSLSQSSLASLSLITGNELLLNIERGATVRNAQHHQTAQGMGELINRMGTQIFNALSAEAGVDVAATSVTTNFAADIVGAIGTAISGIVDSIGGVFGLAPMTVVFLMVSVLAGAYIMKRRIDSLPPGAPMSAIFTGSRMVKKKVAVKPPPVAPTVVGKRDPLDGVFAQGGEHVSYPSFSATAI
jgi:hypothetical protein